jgi:hypothetical protein
VSPSRLRFPRSETRARGYSYTVVQIWVPEDSPAVGESYDPALHIAVPGDTSRQRLIQSGRAHATQ